MMAGLVREIFNCLTQEPVKKKKQVGEEEEGISEIRCAEMKVDLEKYVWSLSRDGLFEYRNNTWNRTLD